MVTPGFSLTHIRQSLLIYPQAQNQPCTDFGIHPRLPFIKELYDEQKVPWLNQWSARVRSKLGLMEICQNAPERSDVDGR